MRHVIGAILTTKIGVLDQMQSLYRLTTDVIKATALHKD
jgi:hypothetical protein